MSTNPYDPVDLNDEDAPEPSPNNGWPMIAIIAAIVFGANGFAIGLGGAPLVGLLLILLAAIFWAGGRITVDE